MVLMILMILALSVYSYFQFVHWRPLVCAGSNHQTFSASVPYLFAPASGAEGPEVAWKTPQKAPSSTFSIDVDTASYSRLRKQLKKSTLPNPEGIRVEELINYFSYDYAEARDEPITLHDELSTCPWNTRHWLLRLAVQARRIPQERRPPLNLVFLIDTSGSMSPPDRLPLLRLALTFLVDRLLPNDRVAIVTYACGAGTLQDPTSDKTALRDALAGLESRGFTNGSGGIQKAYQLARDNYRADGINRVILATDGDFNVGITDHEQLMHLIRERRQDGIFLTTLGFGDGSDRTLEQLADQGNGNYHFIDSLGEARKVLVREAGGTLLTLAKDVKIQVEFNSEWVKSYRLLGYDNRLLDSQDFENDRKDAGEMGSGHSVTALYEIDPLLCHSSSPLAEFRVRYQNPNTSQSKLLTSPISPRCRPLDEASIDHRFAAAVTEFAYLVRDRSRDRKRWQAVGQLASTSLGRDDWGYRSDFLTLINQARELSF